MTNRRSFIKSIASSGIFACLPVLEIRQGISMDLLSRFTDPYTMRWDMKKPFIEREMASATDGRIGIRVADSMRIADEDNPLKIPPLAKVFDQCWKPQSSFHDLPSAKYETNDEWGYCHECIGRGGWGDRSDCGKCYGTGFLEPKFNDWGDVMGDECPSCCGGDVWSTCCPRCKGTGAGTTYAMQLDDGIRVGAGYYHLASQLPGVRWSVGHHASDKPENEGPIVLLDFEGGQAMVCPLRRDES